jgi:MFS family permease
VLRAQQGGVPTAWAPLVLIAMNVVYAACAYPFGRLADRVDNAPAALRGTAFGTFNLAGGVALLAASAVAGWLWDARGAAATFVAGAVFSGLALAALACRRQASPDKA